MLHEMRHLFIGGLADGKIIEVEQESPYWEVAVRTETEPMERPDADFRELEPARKQLYRRRELHYPEGGQAIYIHPPDMPDRVWIHKLINGYKRP